MEYITQIQELLIERFGPLGPLYAVGGLGLLMILFTLPLFLGQKKDPLKKLKESKRSTIDAGIFNK